MAISNIIEIISIVCTSLLSIVAIIISVLTLKQSNKSIVESSRANIVIYFDVLTELNSYIVIKNFGNSVGKIHSITINPKLDYSKSPIVRKVKNDNISEFSNTVLAPNQSIRTWFPFMQYPDKKFNILIDYDTLGISYSESYSIDISYIDDLKYTYTKSQDIPDNKVALNNISNGITRLTEKL